MPSRLLPLYGASIPARMAEGRPGVDLLRAEENMSEFANVTVIKKANVYFDGKVTSRKVVFADGSFKTLGIMLPGEYEFGTNQAELMEIMQGTMQVLLPGETAWKTVQAGESFDVPANASFKLVVDTIVDYCCSYIG